MRWPTLLRYQPPLRKLLQWLITLFYTKICIKYLHICIMFLLLDITNLPQTWTTDWYCFEFTCTERVQIFLYWVKPNFLALKSRKSCKFRLVEKYTTSWNSCWLNDISFCSTWWLCVPFLCCSVLKIHGNPRRTSIAQNWSVLLKKKWRKRKKIRRNARQKILQKMMLQLPRKKRNQPRFCFVFVFV